MVEYCHKWVNVNTVTGTTNLSNLVDVNINTVLDN